MKYLPELCKSCQLHSQSSGRLQEIRNNGKLSSKTWSRLLKRGGRFPGVLNIDVVVGKFWCSE